MRREGFHCSLPSCSVKSRIPWANKLVELHVITTQKCHKRQATNGSILRNHCSSGSGVKSTWILEPFWCNTRNQKCRSRSRVLKNPNSKMVTCLLSRRQTFFSFVCTCLIQQTFGFSRQIDQKKYIYYVIRQSARCLQLVTRHINCLELYNNLDYTIFILVLSQDLSK